MKNLSYIVCMVAMFCCANLYCKNTGENTMLIKKEDRLKFENSPGCIAYEYPLEDKDINVAFVEVKGRYPSTGYVSNELVKEIIFISSGSGRIVIDEDEYELNESDMVMILPNQRYFLEGNFELVVPCSPAWSPEQHEHHEELALSN